MKEKILVLRFLTFQVPSTKMHVEVFSFGALLVKRQKRKRKKKLFAPDMNEILISSEKIRNRIYLYS